MRALGRFLGAHRESVGSNTLLAVELVLVVNVAIAVAADVAAAALVAVSLL